MTTIFDGLRAMRYKWFGDKQLRLLKMLNLPAKTAYIGGFLCKATNVAGIEKARIFSPPGVVVVADTATGMDIYLSDTVTPTTPTFKYSKTVYSRRTNTFLNVFQPYIALVPRGNDYVEVYFDRYAGGQPAIENAALRDCLTGSAIRGFLPTDIYTLTNASYRVVLSGDKVSVHTWFLKGIIVLYVISAEDSGYVLLTADDFSALGLAPIGRTHLTRVGENDVRVVIPFQYVDQYVGHVAGAIELLVTVLDSGFVGIYYMGYSSDEDAFLVAMGNLPLGETSVIDYATSFQDVSGRFCWMAFSGGIKRLKSDMSVETISSPALPYVYGTIYSVFDVSLANGGSYAYFEWHKASLDDVRTVAGLWWGSPFAGTWASVTLPAGTTLSVRPLYCSSERRVFLAVAYAAAGDFAGSWVYSLDTDVSASWKPMKKISADRLDCCSVAVFGSHPYATMLRNYPSEQYVMERYL